MKRWTLIFVAAALVSVAIIPALAQSIPADHRDLRSRIEQHYEVVPSSNAIALVPMSRERNIRLIDISEGVFAINGVTVTGKELRDRVGDDHRELDDSDHVRRCGIGLLGLGSTPLRGSVTEEGVIGQPVAGLAADEIGRLAMSGLSDIPGDLQGSADYRARVGAAMVARAWTGAVRQATTTEAIHA